jgi:transmembrane sensor
METNREHIRSLLFEKISGSISHSDNDLVETAIENDEDIRNMWQEIQQQLGTGRGKQFMDSVDEAERWRAVREQISENPARRPVRKILIATLSAAAVTLVAVLVTIRFTKDSPTIAAPATLATGKALQLKMADGKAIDLEHTGQKTIAAGKVQLNTNGNQLSYTVNEAEPAAWGTLVVPPKLDYRILLSDSTEVWLNSGSSLRFPYVFAGNTREVFLEGEGYFNVTKNAAKPFIVHTAATNIKVLGTSFNVHAYDPNTATTSLVEGSVIASNGSTEVKLVPGKQAIWQGGSFDTRSFDETETLSWMSGISYFYETRLSDIATILNRWYDVKVVFDNPAHANQKFTGAVNKNKPIEVFLSNISISSGIKSSLVNNELHLK